jgi:hypothetical protein
MDRERLAAALAYEQEKRRRLAESVPGLVTTPAQPTPQSDFRTNLENLSIGLGEGLTNQLKGIKGIVTDPVGTARGVYEAGKAVIRDPSVIADALRYTAQQATSGPLGAGEVIGEMLGPRKGGPVMQELDVYHGTPHRFPATEANPLGEFDASKIGTGEGAQAYGHGVYLAEAPEVAEVYRSATNPIARKAEMTLQMTNGNVNKAIEFVKREQKTYERFKNDPIFKQESYQQIVDTLDYLKQTKKGQKPEVGAFYKADLPDEMIDRMLDYDKPLNQQSKQVREALYYIEETHGKIFDESPETGSGWSHVTGHDALVTMKNRLGKFGKGNAEAILLGAGIPGIKYLDAGSRGQGGSGTRNFVVFPGEEKKVRILERK